MCLVQGMAYIVVLVEMQIVVQRNEFIIASHSGIETVEEDFQNYTGAFLMDLWQYAQMGGIKIWK